MPGQVISEVRFVVFQCYECVSVICGVHPVIDAQFRFSVMNASLLSVVSTLSSMPSFVAMLLFSEWMAFVQVDRCRMTVLVYKSSLFCQWR